MKFLLLLWKADASNVKYAIQSWFFLALANVMLSEADSFEMVWNRTVNRNCSGVGKGIHKDLNREFDNRPQKDQIAHLHRNHDPVLAAKASSAMMGINALLSNFDLISDLQEKSSKHKALKTSADINVLVNVLLEEKVFQNLGSRAHSTFPNFDRNPYTQDAFALQQWLKKRATLAKKRGMFCHTLRNSKCSFGVLEEMLMQDAVEETNPDAAEFLRSRFIDPDDADDGLPCD
eukprot:Pompholyxophrys_punicea_v1_NODE_879_length_1175_cov_132.402679.p1 type:complete len:233 gc:universal NODE_879_length_1175_cov_132.402679:776-78(-)